MSESMSPSHEAAAFHGMALNQGRSLVERLQLALRALDLYEGAEERGYRQATADLLDNDAYIAWTTAAGIARSSSSGRWRDHFARFLESRLTEGTEDAKDGS